MTVLVIDFSLADKNNNNNKTNPLNPLGLSLRRWIWESLDRALAETAITSVVLWGGNDGRSFSAGADLTEFGSFAEDDKKTNNPFSLVDLVHKIENYPKPIVAAICGNALGGGLEVALSCHYRIACSNAKTQFGLPEVHVGVIPGAGGTQRLPRLVGVSKALQMILSGKSIGATEAHRLKLVDDCVDAASILQAARKWAEWAELMPLEDRRVGHQKVTESPAKLQEIFAQASRKLPKAEMGGEGVRAALAAVQALSLIHI